MSPWITFGIGIVVVWVLMDRRRVHLENFFSDPDVQAELFKFAQAHIERDRAMKILDAHRKLEQSIFGELNPFSDEATSKIPMSSKEIWSASLERAAAEEHHVIVAYQVWHAYNIRMAALIAHHHVNPKLMLRLIQSYDPQVFC